MNLIQEQNHSTSYLKQQNMYLSSWIELDKQAFFHNIEQIRNLVGPAVSISIVVKGNAYGHGLLPIATLCQEHKDVDWLCTFSLSDAVLLRQHGITKPILVLGTHDDDLAKAILFNIDLALYDYATACELDRIGRSLGKKASIHLKIDTGLSRLGFLAEEAFDQIVRIADLPNIGMRGIFSHFSEADLEDAAYTQLQLRRMQVLLDQLAQVGITFQLRHIANTSTVVRFAAEPDKWNFIRIGGGAYGLLLMNFVRIGGGSFGLLKPYIAQIKPANFLVKPILSWKAKIIQIKRVSASTPISYARTFTTTRETLLGIVPVGYCDGYDRRFSNNGSVFVRGHYAPILGRVCMNIIILDLTEIPDVHCGDEVLLFGNQQGCTADELAHKLGTINHELLTRLNSAIPRIVKE